MVGHELTIAQTFSFSHAYEFSVNTVSLSRLNSLGGLTGFLTFRGNRITDIFPLTPRMPQTGVLASGATDARFAPGTFGPNDMIDLFQDNHSSLLIGHGIAGADGSALIPLNDPLIGGTPVEIGQNGSLILEAQVIPEPDSLAMTLLATLIMMVTRHQRRRQH